MIELIFLIVVVTSIWVFVDAISIGVKRGQIKGLGGMGPFGWFLSCLLLWIVGFPLYLAKRGEFKRINAGSGLKACPFCAESIQKAAIVCKHCKRDLIASAIQG